MAWEQSKFPNLEAIANKICPTKEDFNKLKNIIDKFISSPEF